MRVAHAGGGPGRGDTRAPFKGVVLMSPWGQSDRVPWDPRGGSQLCVTRTRGRAHLIATTLSEAGFPHRFQRPHECAGTQAAGHRRGHEAGTRHLPAPPHSHTGPTPAPRCSCLLRPRHHRDFAQGLGGRSGLRGAWADSPPLPGTNAGGCPEYTHILPHPCLPWLQPPPSTPHPCLPWLQPPPSAQSGQ